MFSRSSVPSGANSPHLSANELRDMHPALIGGGERAAAGLPAGGRGNMLMGTSPSRQPASGSNLLMQAPQATINRLTGMPLAPSQPAPVQPSPPAPPPGQRIAMQVGQAIASGQMPDEALASRIQQSLGLQTILRGLLQKDAVDHGDVAYVVADLTKQGAITPAEGADLMSRISAHDPATLRAKVAQRHLIAMHAAVQLMSEQQRRAAKRAAA